jgi:hypothetical protein
MYQGGGLSAHLKGKETLRNRKGVWGIGALSIDGFRQGSHPTHSALFITVFTLHDLQFLKSSFLILQHVRQRKCMVSGSCCKKMRLMWFTDALCVGLGT